MAFVALQCVKQLIQTQISLPTRRKETRLKEVWFIFPTISILSRMPKQNLK